MKKQISLLATVYILLCMDSEAQNQVWLTFDDPRLQFEGRIGKADGAAAMYWPGSSVRIQFRGSGISALVNDRDTADYLNIILDGDSIRRIHLDRTQKEYRLASGLIKGIHQVELFKRTEWDKGTVLLYGFRLDPESELLAPSGSGNRRLEFYGNSISCGYAVEDSSGNDSGLGYYENNYLSYACLTARHFRAHYACIAKSGIGVMVSWFPLIMPEMFGRLDPNDSLSVWDFSSYEPDVCVIDLFQNDSWILAMPDYPEFRHRFGSRAPGPDSIVLAYRRFVQAVRKKHPLAKIICTLGNMDATRDGSPWPGYIQESVRQLADPNIFVHIFPFKNTPGHPNAREQEAMALDLIAFLEKEMGW